MRSLFLTLLVACTAPFEDEAALGEALFHDTSLSLNRTQSCATCHNPEHAYVDDRTGADGRVTPASLGDDGVSFGARNAPTAAYAQFTPTFGRGTRTRHNKQNNNRLYEGYLGGLFHDGRVTDLAAQAAGPPLNAIEMGMPDPKTVVERLLENEDYIYAFRKLFGRRIFDDDAAAYAAMTESIAAYESTPEFAPFDSRYDRSLRGDVQLTFMELTGKAVFFSEFANCAICHQLYGEGDPINETRETFSGYEYHNIGVPPNEELRALTGTTKIDPGLGGNPAVSEADEVGRFKTFTLRNVAITGPYMHNGVFRELRTVVEFYDHYVNDERPLNPETGEPWREPEVPETVATDLLRVGRPLTDLEVDGLVCFMRALTDDRYTHLLDDGLACD
ncbi:MAG: cytochrome c peroxidase [Myxococcota bacterium]